MFLIGCILYILYKRGGFLAHRVFRPNKWCIGMSQIRHPTTLWFANVCHVFTPRIRQKYPPTFHENVLLNVHETPYWSLLLFASTCFLRNSSSSSLIQFIYIYLMKPWLFILLSSVFMTWIIHSPVTTGDNRQESEAQPSTCIQALRVSAEHAALEAGNHRKLSQWRLVNGCK